MLFTNGSLNNNWARRCFLLGLSFLLVCILFIGCNGDSDNNSARVVYVANDGNVYIEDIDNKSKVQVTNDAYLSAGDETAISYAWPTWSPDNEWVAVSRVSSERSSGDIRTKAILQLIDISSMDIGTIFETPSLAYPFISNRIPHYMHWSPVGANLSFMSRLNDSVGIALLTFNPRATESDRSDDIRKEIADMRPGGININEVAVGSPLWMSWSPNGDTIIAHVGDSLNFIDNYSGNFIEEFDRRPSSWFRVASLSFSGSWLAYTGLYAGEPSFLVSNSDGSGVRNISEVGPRQAFSWSPLNEEIAFSDSGSYGGSSYDGLSVFAYPDWDPVRIINEPILAFFWSPDGEKIAYAAVDVSTGGLTWKVVSRDGSKTSSLVKFIPSRDYSKALLFFDQYSLSHSIWSPDSESIVFAGLVDEDDNENVNSDDESKIYIIGIDGLEAPQEIDYGSIGFWTWPEG